MAGGSWKVKQERKYASVREKEREENKESERESEKRW